MGAAPTRRVDRRTARTTSAILDAAEKLFTAANFHSASMDAIASEAGIAAILARKTVS